MKRSTVGLVGAAAAGALFLAGCGSSGGTAASTTSAPSTANSMTSAMSSTAMSPESSMSQDMTMSTAVSPTGAETTVGGDVTELDSQSVTWFQTFCGGFSGLTDLEGKAQSISTPAQAGELLGTIGQAMTDTGQKLQSVPPPTFEGGDQLASTAQEVFNKIGPAFTTFGQQAATINPNDQAALQKFGSDFQQQLGSLKDVQNIKLSDSVKAAAEKQVPECATLAKMGSGSADASAAPSS